jgi:hypothetical protein
MTLYVVSFVVKILLYTAHFILRSAFFLLKIRKPDAGPDFPGSQSQLVHVRAADLSLCGQHVVSDRNRCAG